MNIKIILFIIAIIIVEAVYIYGNISLIKKKGNSTLITIIQIILIIFFLFLFKHL